VKKSPQSSSRRQLTSSTASIETPEALRRRQLRATRAPRKSRRRAPLAARGGDDDDGEDDILGALHPFKLYRVGTLAKLLCVDRSTIWRMRQRGQLPRFVQVGSICGLTGAQLRKILAEPEAVLAAIGAEQQS
jgi:hypothetical protein